MNQDKKKAPPAKEEMIRVDGREVLLRGIEKRDARLALELRRAL